MIYGILIIILNPYLSCDPVQRMLMAYSDPEAMKDKTFTTYSPHKVLDCRLHGCSQVLINASEKHPYSFEYENHGKPCSDQCFLQCLTEEGLKNLGPYVLTMAEVEGLDAHKRAVMLRLVAIEAKEATRTR